MSNTPSNQTTVYESPCGSRLKRIEFEQELAAPYLPTQFVVELQGQQDQVNRHDFYRMVHGIGGQPIRLTEQREMQHSLLFARRIVSDTAAYEAWEDLEDTRDSFLGMTRC